VGFTRDGTGGGGVLETLGKLTSEETSEWEEPDSKEVVLVVREGAGDGGREDTLEGTPGSAEGERERAPVTGRRGHRNDPTKNRVCL